MPPLTSPSRARREEEFYQHGRQYSSFTQTLLRDLPSRAPTGELTRPRAISLSGSLTVTESLAISSLTIMEMVGEAMSAHPVPTSNTMAVLVHNDK